MTAQPDPSSKTTSPVTVAVIAPNLSLGGTLGGATIARALSSTYPTQLIGCQFGQELWPGLEDAPVEKRIYPGKRLPSHIKVAWEIVQSTDADVIIAHQLRLPSFGTALLHRRVKGSKSILYLDDDDIALTMPGRSLPLRRRLTSATGDLATRLTYRLRNRADRILCGSDVFAEKFHGTPVPLGRDENLFNPDIYDRLSCRQELGIQEGHFVVGFVGNPRPHTGIEDIVQALDILDGDQFALLVAPAGQLNEYGKKLIGGSRAETYVVENAPSDRVPALLAASDAVVLPQRKENMSFGQLPARLVDAMAMAKPIVATDVSDIADLLTNAGIIVPQRSPHEIARALSSLKQDNEAAERLGSAARSRFIEKFSLAAMRDSLVEVIEGLFQQSDTRRRRTDTIP